MRVRSEILGLFLDTLAADHTYSRHNWAKFQQEIQTILSQKWKTHSGIFIAFFQSTQNFAHLEKKDQFHSLSIREVIDECLKAPVLEHPSRLKVLTRTKHF